MEFYLTLFLSVGTNKPVTLKSHNEFFSVRFHNYEHPHLDKCKARQRRSRSQYSLATSLRSVGSSVHHPSVAIGF